MTLNRGLRNYLIDCFQSFNYVIVNIFRRRPRPQAFNGRQRFTKSCALYSAFNLLKRWFFSSVYVRKDDAWENLILPADNVLCLCPQHWTGLHIWSALRLCKGLSNKQTWWKTRPSTAVVRISLLETLHGAKYGRVT